MANAGKLNLGHTFAVVGAVILVGSEIIAAAIAAAWAIAGLFKLGDLFFLIFAVAFGGAALVATIAFARTAARVEPLIDGKK